MIYLCEKGRTHEIRLEAARELLQGTDPRPGEFGFYAVD